MLFADRPFRIPRYMLARLAAEEYVRRFWWFVGIPPVVGLIAMFSGVQLFAAIGVYGVLWPLTIPARAVITSWKAGAFFSHPVRVQLEDDILYFFGEAGKGMKLSLIRVRMIAERNGFVILSYGIGEFVAIPSDIVANVSELRQTQSVARTGYLAETSNLP